MTSRIFDFAHLSPAERIELAGQLWDSLEVVPGAMAEELAADLRRRREALRQDGHLGDDGGGVLDQIAAR
ncbi:MAG: addiction module protein [Gemmatimonadetes bacterium]|nr:addiction module protein [Gemmatimonadota bacterium]